MQNALPSGSASTTQRKLSPTLCRPTSVAPADVSRLTSASTPAAPNSRCTLFLPGVGSSTFWKPSRGPSARMTAMNSPGISSCVSPSNCSAHHSASVAGSTQSKGTISTLSPIPTTLLPMAMTSEVIVRRHRAGKDFQPTTNRPGGTMTDPRSATATTTPRFSSELFAAFWAAPDMSRGMDILAEDIVGYWPGDTEPVRGFDAYTQKIADLLAVAPDLRLELVDRATAAGAVDGEELFFLHYVGHATGPNGPIEIRGLDRVRTPGRVVGGNVLDDK